MYLESFSKVSVASLINCMPILAACMTDSLIGCRVLSCDSEGTLPLAALCASAVLATTSITSGTVPSSGAPSGTPWSCFPAALPTATLATLATRLLASCSAASPLNLSGAPVILSSDPSTPAWGFWIPPVLLSTRAIGAGGNKMGRQGGYITKAIKATNNEGRMMSRSHAKE